MILQSRRLMYRNIIARISGFRTKQRGDIETEQRLHGSSNGIVAKIWLPLRLATAALYVCRLETSTRARSTHFGRA